MTEENNIYGTVTERKWLETGAGYQQISHMRMQRCVSNKSEPIGETKRTKEQGINLIGKGLMFHAEKNLQSCVLEK